MLERQQTPIPPIAYLWVMPFGPVKRSLDELGKVAFDSRAKRLRADVQPRDRGFGSTPM